MTKTRIVIGDFVWARLRNGHVKIGTLKSRHGDQLTITRYKMTSMRCARKNVISLKGSTRLLE